MKHLIALLTLACCFTGYAATPPAKKSTPRYEAFQEQTVVLPTPFAQPFIIDKSDIRLLAGKTIHHVDLVYTKYRSSPGFDQEQLNNQRIAELKKLLPQINADKPSWAWVEQTGATDRETASTCFHGFVIHYTEKQDPNGLRTFFSEKAKPMTNYTVDPEKGGTFSYSSGTKLIVPSNAVTYMDGSPVKGPFELHYREFRNPAEIALSGIPMTYTQKGTEYNFSSVGMYELRGTQGNKELQLKKPVSVDFNCTKVVDDAAFYSLDDSTGEWKKIGAVAFEGAPAEAAEPAIVQEVRVAANRNERVERGAKGSTQSGDNASSTDDPKGLFIEYEILEDNYLVNMNAGAWKKFRDKTKDSTELLNAISSSNKDTRTLEIRKGAYDRLINIVFGIQFVHNAQTNSTLLAENADANHTYPTIVKGLNSPEFGVYNADQIYRIGSPVNLSPVYTDAGTGERIGNMHVACVIDLTYNGSFSFQPNNLICNSKGRNVILLFTNEKKIYLLDEQAFARADKNQLKVNFAMTDVTASLKTPDDLKKLLKL